MRPLALKWRISVMVTVVLIAAIATISAVSYHEMREWLLGGIDRTLLAMANGVLAAADGSESPEQLDAEARAITGNSSRKKVARYRIWLEEGDEDLAGSDAPDSTYGRWLRELDLARRPGPGEQRHFKLRRDGQEYRAIWARGQIARGGVSAVIAYPSHRARHELDEFLRMLLILGGGMVVGSAVVGTLIVLWAIRPIGSAAARLRKVTHRNLGNEDLAALPMPAELRPFMRTVGELLRRLGDVLRRERQFTADASHELRTPLSVAKSTLQVARARDRDAGEYRRAIDETLDDLDRMERLIEQLLALARMDEAEQTDRTAKVCLDALVRELAEAYDAEARQAGGRVVCDRLAAAPVWGDEGLLRRLFSNLLDNAISHGRAGGTVRVTLARDSDRCCTVCVHDEGGGIPPAALEHLFDRFYRVDGSRNRGTGGSGLGLAIARQVALRHGGSITVRSEPAAGTCFCVRLPCM